MSNILVLCSGYFGKAAANGLCAREIVKELENEGHRVGVISVGTDDITCLSLDGAHEKQIIYKKNKQLTVTKNVIVKAWRLGSLFLHSWRPKHNKDVVRKMTALAKEQCRENAIDAIVCVFFPLEAVLSGYGTKKQFPDAKYIIYELDSVADGIAGGSKWHKPIAFSYKRIMGKVYKKADRVIVMESHGKHWSTEHAKSLTKMKISDLPVLVDPCLPKVEKDGSDIKFLYSGALFESFRSPKKLLDTFKLLDVENCTLDFYTKGCETELESARKLDSRITCHGYVDKKELDAAIADADVLVSLGNAVSNSIPSKVITYMTYGKPIIHFSLQEKDVCAGYLEKYPLSLVIKHNEDIAMTKEKIETFVKTARGKTVGLDLIKARLEMNTPSYSANLITQVLDGGRDGST